MLELPDLPLHTNDMELAARRRVRKRDVSFGPQSRVGARAWDTFQTIAATAAMLQRSSPGRHDRLRIPAHLRELTTQPREAALALRRGRREQRGGQRLPGGDQLLGLWSLNTYSALARAGGLRIP